MRYCTKCGQAMEDGAAFCGSCGAPAATETPAPVAPPVSQEALVKEEYEFLETTHRLLRWEHKAWSIASKVWLIAGIVFASIYALLSLITLADSAALALMMFIYAALFGGMFIALGIVSKKAAEKIPQYIDTVYTDFSLAYNRCGNVGMLVFNALCGVISPIFFIINFVRMKANGAVIERIMQKQGVQK